MKISAPAMVLNQANIDTDQIIPARFLTTTVRAGLGKSAFYDWRYSSSGEAKAEFPLNQSQAKKVLIAGRNFGCGSSREHAPWALLDAGIQAVISTEIADIFRSNSLKNGLVTCVIDADAHAQLLAEVEADPSALIEIDVESLQLRLPSGKCVSFPMDKFAQHCLLQGVDQLGFLLALGDKISDFEKSRRNPEQQASVIS